LQEPEQDAANGISEASWLRVKGGPEGQRSEALLSPVLQGVTVLSSSYLRTRQARPVDLPWSLRSRMPIPPVRQGLAASSPFQVIILKGSSSREVGWE